MNLGEEVTVSQIAKDLHDQTTWITSAVETEEKDIIVTLQSGNIFQVFYSENYGQAFVEYIGKDDGNNIPTLTANYDEASNSMKVTAEVSGGEIKQVEMFYRGEGQGIKRGNETTGEMSFPVAERGNGWYIIKATDNNNKMRYIWKKALLIDETLSVPLITVSSSESMGGEWYRTPVTVTITAGIDTSKGQSIRYRVVSASGSNTVAVNNTNSSTNAEDNSETGANNETNGGTNALANTDDGTAYTEPITIEAQGLTTIYAWTTNGTSNSTEAKRTIRIDTEAPSINEPNVTQLNGKAGTNREEKTWYTSDVQIEVTGNDNHSRPIHYEYSTNGGTNWNSKQIDEKISITGEGETTIIVRTVDTAGNKSEEKRVTFAIDKTGPIFSPTTISISQSDITENSVRFIAYATDEGSGKNGGITYRATVTSIDGGTRREGTSQTGEFSVDGLNKDTGYTIIVTAEDPLGNSSKNRATGGFRTKGDGEGTGEGNNGQGNNGENWNSGGNNGSGNNGSSENPGGEDSWVEPTEFYVRAVAKNTSDIGNNDWVKGPVEVTIKDNSGASGIAYTYYEITNNVTGEVVERDGPIPGRSTKTEFEKNGYFTIKAWITQTTDENAEKAAEAEATCQIDKDFPASPNITVSTANAGPATDVENKQYYYHDKATVIVEPRTDATSGIYGVRIEVEGANTIAASDYATRTSKEIDITKEGDSVVRAWTIDNAGNISQQATEIVIHLDNTKPEEVLDLNLAITSGTSPLSNGWYNTDVEVTMTVTSNVEDSQISGYNMVYGTRTKGSEQLPTNTTTLTGKTAVIPVTGEGTLEVVAYAQTQFGVISDMQTIDVQIDKTRPTIKNLKCEPEENAIRMTIEGASDGSNGAGLANAIFFIDGKATADELITQAITSDGGRLSYRFSIYCWIPYGTVPDSR